MHTCTAYLLCHMLLYMLLLTKRTVLSRCLIKQPSKRICNLPHFFFCKIRRHGTCVQLLHLSGVLAVWQAFMNLCGAPTSNTPLLEQSLELLLELSLSSLLIAIPSLLGGGRGRLRRDCPTPCCRTIAEKCTVVALIVILMIAILYHLWVGKGVLVGIVVLYVILILVLD